MDMHTGAEARTYSGKESCNVKGCSHEAGFVVDIGTFTMANRNYRCLEHLGVGIGAEKKDYKKMKTEQEIMYGLLKDVGLDIIVVVAPLFFMGIVMYVAHEIIEGDLLIKMHKKVFKGHGKKDEEK